MKKINTFFQPVSAARKSANLQLEKISLDEKLEMEEKNRLAKDAILKASMEERIAESRKRRANVKEIDAHLSDHYCDRPRTVTVEQGPKREKWWDGCGALVSLDSKLRKN
jgi:hypothetical protein